MVFYEGVVYDFSILIGDEFDASRFSSLLIYLRISYKNSLLFIQIEILDDL